jgi:hypothetical protein
MTDDKESVVGTSAPPRKSDVLFGSGGDWQTNAAVHTVLGATAYQDGYRNAALHLAEYVCGAGRGQDFLVYPIVYLYRHHIELTLKSIIKAAAFVVDHTLTQIEQDTLVRSHDLAKLWNLARPMLSPACELGGESSLPQTDLEGIDSYIDQLHQHDPDGQRFRYWTIRGKGQKPATLPSLPNYLIHINIRNFADGMEKLADYLEAFDNEIGDLIDAKIEYQAKRAREGW